MNIDIRKIIVNTLFTIYSKTGCKTISWDDIAKYIYMLEKKYGQKINLVYTNDFDVELYEKMITQRVESDNVYFDLNGKNTKFSKKIVDINLLLGKKDNNELTIGHFKPTINAIHFISLFNLFIVTYVKQYGYSINKNEFWNIIESIKSTLESYGIKVESANKLELFRIAYMYDKSQRIDLHGDNINVNIEDIEDFASKTIHWDKNTLGFLNNIINYHLIGIDNQKSKSK